MRAAVLERDRRPILQSIEHDRLAENDSSERLPSDFMIERGDVPIIPEEHDAFLRRL